MQGLVGLGTGGPARCEGAGEGARTGEGRGNRLRCLRLHLYRCPFCCSKTLTGRSVLSWAGLSWQEAD